MLTFCAIVAGYMVTFTLICRKEIKLEKFSPFVIQFGKVNTTGMVHAVVTGNKEETSVNTAL